MRGLRNKESEHTTEQMRKVPKMDKRLTALYEMPELPREPYEDCPRFDTCSVNKCPLSSRYALLENVEHDRDADGKEIPFTGDPETRCFARRKTREDLANRYPGILPNGGLLDIESARDRKKLAERAKWDALPPEIRAERLAKLKEMRARIGKKPVVYCTGGTQDIEDNEMEDAEGFGGTDE